MMTMLDFLQIYTNDKLEKNIDEIQGSPLVREMMVNKQYIQILEAAQRTRQVPPP